MNNLRELTKDSHTNAERSPFVKILFSGKIDPHVYATYLFNQHRMYDILEAVAMMHGLLNEYPTVRRAPNILEDFNELWEDTENLPTTLPATQRYIAYIMAIKDDPRKILAHLYVRHFGDLSGGRMLAKRIPGSGKYYQFDGDPEIIKETLRKLS